MGAVADAQPHLPSRGRIGYYYNMAHDELSEYLEALARDDCYRVDALLSESACEKTQRVYFLGSNGSEIGPYVRKLLRRESGLGNAYRRIYDAQRAGRRFKHIPHILECHDAGEDLVAVMELVEGESLRDLIEFDDPSVELACAVFPELCDAVTELHVEFDPPLIHRDLKPSNVIVCPRTDGAGKRDARTRYDVTVIDFDISRVLRTDAGSDTVHFGTPGFAPPEQFGFEQTTERSDVYALGGLLYFCLTGEIPNEAVRQRGWSATGVPERLRQVVAKATSFAPDDRYASASELKAAFLEACAAEQAESASSHPGSTATGAETKRTLPIAAIAAIAVALVAFAIVVMGFGSTGSGQKGDESASSAHSVQSEAPAQSAESDQSGESAQSAESDQSGESAQSAESDQSGQPSQSAESAADQSIEDLPESVIEAGLQTPGEPKDGFDPQTNFTVEIAGVLFQIPSYFKTRTQVNDDGTTYYYAEQGSSVAMIMTKENPDLGAGSREVFDANKGAYVSGVLETGGPFETVTGAVDYELAGHSARMVALRGAVQGIPVTSKMAFFYDEDTDCVGTIVFGQTTNVQFDYASDFAKVLTSAKRNAG